MNQSKKKLKSCILILIWISLLPLSLSAQQFEEVSGTVTDSEGLPVPGAAVTVKGTTSGTITDVAGKYSIKAKEQLFVNFFRP